MPALCGLEQVPSTRQQDANPDEMSVWDQQCSRALKRLWVLTRLSCDSFQSRPTWLACRCQGLPAFSREGAWVLCPYCVVLCILFFVTDHPPFCTARGRPGWCGQGSQHWPCPSPAVWPQASRFSSLGLSFPIWKTRRSELNYCFVRKYLNVLWSKARGRAGGPRRKAQPQLSFPC